MGLFDNIDKLITEHGSANILRDRLLLAEDKYSALERKLAATESEKLRLQEHGKKQAEEIERLTSELQRLKAEQAANQALPEILEDKKKGILIAVARFPDGTSLQRLVNEVHLHQVEAKQALAELSRDDYLRVVPFMSGPKYALSERGRKYLIDNKLLH